MSDWLVRVGAYEVKREMYKSCTCGDMMGRSWRKMSGHVGSSRHKSGQVGRNFFFVVLVVVTLLHQFLRVWSLFPVLASSLRCSSTALTVDRLMPVSWRWGAGDRIRMVRVASSRVMSGQSGQFSFFGSLPLTSSTVPWCLCWVMGSLHSCKGPSSSSDSQPAGVMA